MVYAVGAVLKDEQIEDDINATTFGNDAGAGFDKDWIQMLELNEIIAAEGTYERIKQLEEDFEDGKINVFQGDYIGVNPYDESDVIDLNNGYIENASSSAPAFCYILQDVIIIEE